MATVTWTQNANNPAQEDGSVNGVLWFRTTPTRPPYYTLASGLPVPVPLATLHVGVQAAKDAAQQALDTFLTLVATELAPPPPEA